MGGVGLALRLAALYNGRRGQILSGRVCAPPGIGLGVPYRAGTLTLSEDKEVRHFPRRFDFSAISIAVQFAYITLNRIIQRRNC